MGTGRMVACCGLVVLAGCFGKADAYRCAGDDQCNAAPGGVCELSSEYCSYPDASCPSMKRYDELAGSPLKGTCVDVEDEGESSSESSGTGSSDDSSSSSSSEATGIDEPCPICEDLDGDGFGFGPDCAGPDCDDANAMTTDGCLYVAPDGSDANAGTDPEAPWGTLAHAVGELQPGDSLVLLPGLYESATTGLLSASCIEGGNATTDASASAPISIRGGRDPSEERQAILSTDGSAVAIELDGCKHWRLHGLTARGGDLEGGVEDLVRIIDGASIVADRLLVSSPNGSTGSHGIWITGSADVLLTDSEIYDFHLTGVYAYQSERITFRRLYIDSRGREDPPGTPAPTYLMTTGDHGIRITGGSGHRIENCIVTDTGYALAPNAEVDIAGTIGLELTSGILSLDGTLRIRDLVVVTSVNHGVDLRSPRNTVLDGVTILDSGLSGLVTTEDISLPCSGGGGCSLDARNVISARNGDTGIVGEAPVEWSVVAANAFGNGERDYGGYEEPIDDAEGIIQNSLSEPADDIGLGLGQCAVFIGEGSAMKGRGVDGADIGANVLYRLVDGELTDEPLWDPETGAFPCGAIVAGINDMPSASCFDVHERLNVGHNDCALPFAPPSCDAG